MQDRIEITKAKKENMPEIQKIYVYARKYMKETGNATQWGDHSPAEEILFKDIQNENLYVIWQNGHIHAVFAFIIGKDPTYDRIEQGRWLSKTVYGTIHRVAGDGQIKGVFDLVMAFCNKRIRHLRIDTHQDNKVMQHLILKNGFQKCGIIYVADGSPRIAYEKTEEP